MRIESRRNSRVKELRAGLQHGGETPHGHIAIEGEHLLLEAVRSGLRIPVVFVLAGREDLLECHDLHDSEVLILAEEVFTSVTATQHPQGIAALVQPPEFHFEQMLRGVPLVVVAAALQDPGNLGTLIRSAEAFGATGMILLPGTVSVWNGKALRASSGSAFRLPILPMTAENAFTALRTHSVQLIAAVARQGVSEADFSGPTALLLGNEGVGLPAKWTAEANRQVTIRCPGPVESLNSAVAGSVLLYEAARQRQALHHRSPAESPVRPVDAKQPRRLSR